MRRLRSLYRAWIGMSCGAPAPKVASRAGAMRGLAAGITEGADALNRSGNCFAIAAASGSAILPM